MKVVPHLYSFALLEGYHGNAAVLIVLTIPVGKRNIPLGRDYISSSEGEYVLHTYILDGEIDLWELG